SAPKFKRRLPIPRVITDPEIEIRMRKAKLDILPGPETEMWTYDGSFPGPTIRRPSGEPTRITFRHDLPENAGEMTVHLHGAHTASIHDGQPGGLTERQPRSLYCDIAPGLSERAAGNDLLIEPGRKRTYVHEFTEDGEPERGAMHWYHDHRLDRTGENVWRGLAGMWITDDGFEDDAGWKLPSGKQDIPLLITDRKFDSKNRLVDRFKKLEPPTDGMTGDVILVNGAVVPFHKVEPRHHRLRILNASNFRPYNLFFTHGVEIVQIATESGLMPAPVARDRVLLGAGERVELIVDFSGAAGERVELRSGARTPEVEGVGSNPYNGPIMQFRVSDDPVDDEVEIPASLRPLPGWAEDIEIPAAPFTWSVSGGALGNPWLINGETFDPSRVLRTESLGEIAVWRISNNTQYAHMMHPHHTDWLMLGRNGSPPEDHEACLKETFFLDPFESILVAGKMSDYTGKYVIHCHMLDHEDHGLMSQFEVV
ncbi:MAG: multicopper oxidase family protein, partial [Actinomycetota bacterium]|nr:multicopper oxidase family protein [Actinomycetota bacterium]